MPLHEGEAYLREAIESVLGQTYVDWELIVIDDGSTDGGPAIVASYAAARPDRIRLVSTGGPGARGASAARNVGISAARGDFIAFLDADDVWKPGKLTDQVPLLEQRPEAALLYGDTEYWFSWTGAAEDAGRDFCPPLGVPSDSIIAPPQLLVRTLRDEATVPCTCSVLVRRCAVERVGGFEERFQRVFTDQAFYAKLFLSYPVYVASGCWDRYRRHRASSVAMFKARGELVSARRDYLCWLRQRVHDDPALRDVRRAIRRAEWVLDHPRTHRLLRRARTFWWRQRARWLGRELPPRESVAPGRPRWPG